MATDWAGDGKKKPSQPQPRGKCSMLFAGAVALLVLAVKYFRG